MALSHELLQQKLEESLARLYPPVTARDTRLPAIPNKAVAVIGVRRGGKTSFLMQCRAERIAQGRPEASELHLSLEDERLAGMRADDLAWMVDEHQRRFPDLRRSTGITLYLDEVQLVAGWEGLVRRLMDSGGTEVFLTGSSAKLLSREVATSLRGRAMEVLMHPFSFREALRHDGVEPASAYAELTPDERTGLDNRLRRYLNEGGFPEAQRANARDRAALLTGYVDIVVLRDVIERHGISNPVALRWIQRQLLANPAGAFSVNKHYDALRSQGIPVSKDTLYAYLSHLEDTFLIRTVSMHSTSERQRMSNPRKAYPVDPALIALFEKTGRSQTGRALETVVLLELERRGWEATYVRNSDDTEVDFLAHRAGDQPLLVQVSLETEGDETWTRELHALEVATKSHPDTNALLLTLDAAPPRRPLPTGIKWMSAAAWLLERS